MKIKNKIISLCLFLICSIKVFSEQEFLDNFEYYRAYTNYKGTAYNGSSIIVYGDAGVITRSIDGGNNWMRVSLPDSFNIMSITNLGFDYYGVLNRKYIIQSTDNGSSWQLFDFADIDFYKILPYNNNLYCMSNNKIIAFNKNLVRIKEYNISVDSAYYDFIITEDNLIYSSGKGELTQINLLNDKTKIIKMSDYGICTNCPVPTNLFNRGNKTYFKLGFNLFSYDGTKAESVFNTGRVTSFNSNGNSVFAIYTYTTGLYSLRDSLLFVKINEQTKKSERINKEENDRYISKLTFKELKFLSVDTVIAVGKNMLIYMSYDAGVKWQLKSNYRIDADYGEKFILDKNHIAFVAPYVKFIKTTDAGVTWLPQSNYDEIYENERFGDILNNFKSFFGKLNNGYAHYYSQIQNYLNFAYSKNYCDSVLLKNNSMPRYYMLKPFKTCMNKGQSLLAHQSVWQSNQFSIIYQIDDEVNATRRTLFDSAHVVFMDTFDNEELLTLVINYRACKIIDSTAYYDSVYVSLLSSSDTAHTWNKLFDFFILDSNGVINNISKIGDNIFISLLNPSHTSHIYMLNTKTLEINEILTKYEWQTDVNGVVKAGSKAFINSAYFRQNGIEFELLQNDDIEKNPNVWKTITPKRRYSSFSIISKYDSLIFISAYDSLMKTPTCWFAKPKIVMTVQESEIEKQNYLYCYPPYPNPSVNFVRSLIFWDTCIDIENDDISVYDIYGNKVAGKEHITIDKQNQYSGLLTWNCLNVPDGTYLIRIIHGTETRTMKVIVSK